MDPDPATSASQAGEPEEMTVLEHLVRGGGLRELLPLEGVEDEPLYAFGYEMYSQGRYLQALTLFGLLMARRSFEPRFIRAFAACLQCLDRPAIALPHYLTATALDPSDPVPIFHACECLLLTGCTEQARQGLVALQPLCRPGQHDVLLKKAQGLLALIDKRSYSTN